MVNDGDHGGLVLGRMGYVGQVGYDLCGSGFGLVGGGGLISIGVMQWRGSGGATTWVVGVAAWVWFLTVDCSVFFFFFGGVDGRLWVASGGGGGGGGGVRCVLYSGGGDCGS